MAKKMTKKNQNSLHSFVILAYKESEYLESCIKSVINQNYKSNVLIATTTPNSHIKSLAKKYGLQIIESEHTDIGGDFDFAKNSGDTPLITVAHQDDIYEKNYSEEIIKAYQKHQDSTIIFSDYYEIRAGKKIYTNTLLKIKRILLTPAKMKHSLRSKHFKRFILKYGNSICCPAVTFVKDNCPRKVFSSSFVCNVDWHAWETLSKEKGAFTFVNKKLMGHRISEDSTTTDIIKQGIRTKEDYEIFKRFWPKWIAKSLTKFYQKSEKSNSLKEK